MIPAPLLPYLLLAFVVITTVVGGGGYLKGRADGRALETGQQAHDEQLAAKVGAEAQNAAAKAIAGIQIKHTTIRQQAEKEIRENTVYRNPECAHTDSMLQRINEALTGADGSGGSKLPADLSATRQDLRGDHAEADRAGQPVPALSDGGAGERGEQP